MKQYNNIIGIVMMLAVVSAAWVSCTTGDDNPSVALPDLEIVKVTDTDLNAKGDTAVITLNRTPSKVWSDDAWVKIIQYGNKVEVIAPANSSREKRNTMVYIEDGNSMTDVNISQEGLVLGYLGDRVVVHSYKQKEVAVGIVCNEQQRVRIISQPSWINATMDGDSLRMKVAENKNGNSVGPIRMGYVKFGIDNAVDSVKVIQYYRTNLKGTDKWYLGGYLVTFDETGAYSINTNQTNWLPASLSFTLGNEGKFTLNNVKIFSDMPAVKLVLRTVLDPENMSFTFGNGEFVTNIGDSIYIAETLIGAGFMRTFGSEPQGKFALDIDDSGNFYGRITGEFPTSSGNLDIIGMWFCAFKSQEFTYSAYYGQGRGDLFGFTPCWLMMNQQ